MRADRKVLAALAAANVLAVTSFGANSAFAQNSVDDAIANCRSQATEDERLACFEGLVRGRSTVPQAPEPAAPNEILEQPDEPPVMRDEDAAASEDGSRRGLRVPFLGRRNRETEVATDRAPESDEPESYGPESYGSEQIEVRSSGRNTPARLSARVVDFEEIPYRRLRVELDNGQVWEQAEGVPPWREEQYGAPDEVEIYPSRFGGYRMRLVGKNLTLRVRRAR